MLMAYYNACKYLVPFGDATSEAVKESLREILQSHYMNRPHRHTTTEHEEKTYCLLLDDAELEHYEASNYQNIKLSSWKQGLTRVHQHLRLFERVQSAMDYYTARARSAMGGTTATLLLKDKRHLLAINIYPRILIKRGLMAYYERDGAYYREIPQ